jgi:hypothetical protein
LNPSRIINQIGDDSNLFKNYQADKVFNKSADIDTERIRTFVSVHNPFKVSIRKILMGEDQHGDDF